MRNLLSGLGNNAGTHGTATLTDSEAQAFLNGDGGDQLHVHDHVVAGHAHLNALGQGDDAGHVGGTEVELRTIVVEEGGMTAALVLGQDVHLARELGVGLDGAGLSQNLASLDLLLVDTTQQGAHVVAGLSIVQQLAEHLDAVTAAFGVRNFENIEQGISEMYRVLKPGGHIMILELSTPEHFPMRQLYQIYSKTVIPFIGRLLSKEKAAYNYLPASIKVVPQGKVMTDLLTRQGFKQARVRTFTFGICSLYTGSKE